MLFAENNGELLGALADSHKLRFYYLSDRQESRRADVPGIVEELKAAEAKGNSTRLGSAICGVLDDLRGTTPVAIVLATDGINTDGPGLHDGAAYARRQGVPLLFIGLGSDRPARDLKLSDLEVEDVVFVNDLVHFRFKLTAAGFAGKKVAIVLRENGSGGAEDKGETVGRIEVAIAADGRPQEIVLPHRPTQPGQFHYTIDVEPPPGDAVARHPPLARSIRVRTEKIRVLLVEGPPRWEYRFLHNMLSRDKTIDLHTLLQEADAPDPNRAAEADKGKTLSIFPVRREELFDLRHRDLRRCQSFAAEPCGIAEPGRFRRSSGQRRRLVLIAGPNFMPQAYRNTPLARLMPFDPANARNPKPGEPLTEGFVVQPTEMGLASPPMQLGDSLEQTRAIWEKLPPMYWMTEVSDLKPSARVLAEHPTRNGPTASGCR